MQTLDELSYISSRLISWQWAARECCCARGDVGHSVCVLVNVHAPRGHTAPWLRSTALAGRGSVLPRAGAFTQHCPASTTPAAKRSNRNVQMMGEGCQAHGTATKRKLFPSEGINHSWCLGVNTQISQPCVSQLSSTTMDNQTLLLLQSWGLEQDSSQGMPLLDVVNQ